MLIASTFALPGQSKKVKITNGQIGNYKGNVIDLCISPSGESLIVPEAGGICFYDIETKALFKKWENVHSKSILALDISSDGTLLSSGGSDSIVIIRNIKSGKIERKFIDQKGVITSLAFNSDNSMLASGSSGKTVSVYNLSDGSIKYKLGDFQSDITAVKFSPNDQLLAVASLDKMIQLFNTSNGRLTATLDGHKNSVRDIAFSKDGMKLFSCGDDSRVIEWDIRKPDQIKIEKIATYKPSWLLTLDVRPEATVVSGLDSKIRVNSNFVNYEGKIGGPVNKILFIPGTGTRIKLALATRTKGVFIIDVLQFETKN